VRRVEAEEAQVAGELSQVAVQGEAGIIRQRQVHRGDGGDVEAAEERVGRHPVTVGEEVVEVGRLAVHQQQVDLRVGDTQGLQGILDAARNPKR